MQGNVWLTYQEIWPVFCLEGLHSQTSECGLSVDQITRQNNQGQRTQLRILLREYYIIF